MTPAPRHMLLVAVLALVAPASITASGEPGVEPESLESWVEFVGGDILPGVVEGYRSGSESLAERLPRHLLVRPLVPVDLPDGAARRHVRVALDQVRRVVQGAGRTGPPLPNTIRFKDGRQAMPFRSLRWSRSSLLLLSDTGTTKVGFDAITELNLGSHAPWEAYLSAVAILAPQATGTLERFETSGGLVATTSQERLRTVGSDDETRHVIQPAWSLDPIVVMSADLTARRPFQAGAVPLPLIGVARAERSAVFGGSWNWQVNRNVQGGTLAANGCRAEWGFGVQASCILEFPLPSLATAFRGAVGLDDLAGSGGCAVARVCLGSAEATPLWESGLLIGSGDVMETGDVSLEARPDLASSLVLVADMAHDRRPPAADPHDIRDLVDWLDPVVVLDPEKLRDDVKSRLPASIPAWDGWIVSLPSGATLEVRNLPSEAAAARGVLARGGPLALSRTIDVSADTKYIVIGATCDHEQPGRIEIRVDGKAHAAVDVPRQPAGKPAEPFLFPLDRFAGKTVKVEIVQPPAAAPDFVEWHTLDATGPLESVWEPVEIVEATSEAGATIEPSDDGSLVVSGANPANDVYTVRLRTKQQGVTGLRLEALRHKSLPRGGPGRHTNNNFVLTNFTAEVAPVAEPDVRQPVSISAVVGKPVADRDGMVPAAMIDADPHSGWCNFQQPAAVVLQLSEPVGFPGGTEFILTLSFLHPAWEQHTLGCFRLATTTATYPSFQLPGALITDETAVPAAAR